MEHREGQKVCSDEHFKWQIWYHTEFMRQQIRMEGHRYNRETPEVEGLAIATNYAHVTGVAYRGLGW